MHDIGILIKIKFSKSYCGIVWVKRIGVNNHYSNVPLKIIKLGFINKKYKR